MSEETAALTWLRAFGRAALVALVLAGGGFAFAHRGALDAAAIAEALAHYPAAPLVFLLCHILASLVFFPRTVLAVAAGVLWGIWWGTLWAALGSVLGAIAGFLLARSVNRGLVDLENLRRLGPILRRAEGGGWRAVAMLRLVPIIPHSLSNCPGPHPAQSRRLRPWLAPGPTADDHCLRRVRRRRRAHRRRTRRLARADARWHRRAWIVGDRAASGRAPRPGPSPIEVRDDQ